MATFTIELWRLLEMYPEKPRTYENVGLHDYPIFDPAYRVSLNEKIIRHYYNQEIGQETYPMWKFAMRRTMHEVMPFYNKLYESAQIEFDPLATIDIRTVATGENRQTAEATATSESTNTSDAGSRAVQSQTPQVLLSGQKDYATSAADSNSHSEGTAQGQDSTNTTSEENSNTVSETKGYQGNPSELIASYRATLLNIDLMVIGELRDMFMLVWNSGDTYTTTKGYLY